MRAAVLAVALTALVSGVAGLGQVLAQERRGTVLDTVLIPEAVLADGTELGPGTYQLRLTDEHPEPFPGQTREARQWVELVQNGTVVRRVAAEVLRDDDLPAIGASSQVVSEGTRVDRLRGGDVLRVSVKTGRVRYLLHFVVSRP